MGTEVPLEDPNAQYLTDPSFDFGGTFWVGSARTTFVDGCAIMDLAPNVVLRPEPRLFPLPFDAYYKLIVEADSLNNVQWQVKLGVQTSPWYFDAGIKTFYLFSPAGNQSLQLQSIQIGGAHFLKVCSIECWLNTSPEIQAYLASITENLVPPSKTKYEYWEYPTTQTLLLANHDWPANVLIKRGKFG